MVVSETQTHLPRPRMDRPTRVLIVQSPYYADIADHLLSGAQAALAAAGADSAVLAMPGALEIPPAIALAARSGDFDGFVALGCVIRGETSHYDIVAGESARGLMELGLRGLAIGNGILTVDRHEQALLRADPAGQNKGGGAADACLHLIAAARAYRRTDRIPGADDGIRLAGTPPTDGTRA